MSRTICNNNWSLLLVLSSKTLPLASRFVINQSSTGEKRQWANTTIKGVLEWLHISREGILKSITHHIIETLARPLGRFTHHDKWEMIGARRFSRRCLKFMNDFTTPIVHNARGSPHSCRLWRFAFERVSEPGIHEINKIPEKSKVLKFNPTYDIGTQQNPVF